MDDIAMHMDTLEMSYESYCAAKCYHLIVIWKPSITDVASSKCAMWNRSMISLTFLWTTYLEKGYRNAYRCPCVLRFPLKGWSLLRDIFSVILHALNWLTAMHYHVITCTCRRRSVVTHSAVFAFSWLLKDASLSKIYTTKYRYSNILNDCIYLWRCITLQMVWNCLNCYSAYWVWLFNLLNVFTVSWPCMCKLQACFT